jgi:hypothetical protein
MCWIVELFWWVLFFVFHFINKTKQANGSVSLSYRLMLSLIYLQFLFSTVLWHERCTYCVENFWRHKMAISNQLMSVLYLINTRSWNL